MSKALATLAEKRANDGLGTREPLHCQQWVRECYEVIYGKSYDRYRVGSAKLAGLKWFEDSRLGKLPSGVVVLKTGNIADTQLGDILYRVTGSGGFGHVGIRVLGNRVAENSVAKFGRTHPAIGFRKLLLDPGDPPAAEWGPFQYVVRLPERTV